MRVTERTLATWCIVTTLIMALGMLPGCAGSPGPTWWNPATWGSNRSGAVAQAQASQATAQSAVLKQAQGEVRVAALALQSAEPSRPVDVAREAVADAENLQAQAIGPLSEAERQRLEKLVAGLLSENEAIRTDAEKQRQTDREAIAKISAELERATARLAEQQGKLSVAYERERELANRYRNLRLMAVGVGVAGIVGTGVALWLRFNAAGALRGVVGAVQTWKRSSVDPSAVEALKAALSSKLDTKQKKIIDDIRVTL
jgi:hypothetical protein